MTVGYGGELAFGSTEEKTEGAREKQTQRERERRKRETARVFLWRGPYMETSVSYI